MFVVCSYCGDDLGEKAPLEDRAVSHSMCSPCATHFQRQWRGITLDQYLDDFEHPVIVVDSDGRLVAANKKMAAMQNVREGSALVGLLGGDAMECAYARLPGGCGQTAHCHTCGIRRAVRRTFETGEPIRRAPVHLDRAGGRVHLLLTTWPRGDTVVVTVTRTDEPA